MKKYIILLFFTCLFFTNCLNDNTTGYNKTLADLAGSYEGYGFYLIIKKDGDIQFVDIDKLSYRIKIDSSLPEFSFYINNFSVYLTDTIKIEGVKLEKTSDNTVFFTTVEDRIGIYDCKDSLNNNLVLTIDKNSSVDISFSKFTSLDISSIEKVFTVKEYPLFTTSYKIDFELNTLTGITGANSGNLYIMTKR